MAGFLLVGCQKKQQTPDPSPLPSPTVKVSPVPQLTEIPTYSYTATQSGQVAMDLLTASETVETVDYGTAGLFVQSINGIEGDNTAYWAFYVNGDYAKLGASQTKLQKGDTIKFVYETVSASEALTQ